MTAIVLIVVALVLIGMLSVVHAARSTDEGYEDEVGFHIGENPKKVMRRVKSSKGVRSRP
jgi:hypothetical protein